MADDDTRWGTEAVTAAKLNALGFFAYTNLAAFPSSSMEIGAKGIAEDTGVIYQNTGTYATPSWTALTHVSPTLIYSHLPYTADGQVVDDLSRIAGDAKVWKVTSVATTTKNLDFVDNADSNITAFSDDMTSYDTDANFDLQWINADGTVIDNIASTNTIDCTLTVTASNVRTTYDFGAATLSDTTWEVRFKILPLTIHTGTGRAAIGVMISATDQPPRNTAHDGYGLFLETASSASNFEMLWADANDLFDSSTGTSTLTGVTAITPYWCKFGLEAGQIYTKIYTDSSYKNLFDSDVTAATGTITALRYLMIGAASTGTITGTESSQISDIQFFNGYVP